LKNSIDVPSGFNGVNKNSQKLFTKISHAQSIFNVAADSIGRLNPEPLDLNPIP